MIQVPINIRLDKELDRKTANVINIATKYNCVVSFISWLLCQPGYGHTFHCIEVFINLPFAYV